MPTWRDRRVTLLRELTRAAGAAYVDAQEGRSELICGASVLTRPAWAQFWVDIVMPLTLRLTPTRFEHARKRQKGLRCPLRGSNAHEKGKKD